MTDALQRIRSICSTLPGVTETLKHGRPAFAVREKAFLYFMDNHHADGRLAIWCKAPPGAQDVLLDLSPEQFFKPPYLGPSGWIGVHLNRGVRAEQLKAIITGGHAMNAPKPKRRGSAKTVERRDRSGTAVGPDHERPRSARKRSHR